MKRTVITSLAVLAVWCGVGTSFAAAQFGTLGQQQQGNPFINPSMNMYQGGFNTYGILRGPFDPSRATDPFFATQRLNADGSLQGLLANQNNANALGGLQTGHSVTFLDYAHYFPMNVPTMSSTGAISNTGQGFGSHSQNPAVIQSNSFNSLQRR